MLKNENQLEGMVSIMETLQDYVPCTNKSEVVPSVGSESTEVIEADHFHQILFGGEQITCACARRAQRTPQNSLSGKSGLKGFVPVVEDWYAKACFLGVSVIIILLCPSTYVVGMPPSQSSLLPAQQYTYAIV